MISLNRTNLFVSDISQKELSLGKLKATVKSPLVLFYQAAAYLAPYFLINDLAVATIPAVINPPPTTAATIEMIVATVLPVLIMSITFLAA